MAVTPEEERVHEEAMMDLGYEMYFEEIERAQQRGTHTLMGAHNLVLHRELDKLIHAIEVEQHRLAIDTFGRTGGGRGNVDQAAILISLDPAKTAYICIRYGLTHFISQRRNPVRPYSTHAQALGAILDVQLAWDTARQQEKILAEEQRRFDRFKRLLYTHASVTARSARRHLARFDDLVHHQWTPKLRAEVAGRLLYLMVDTCNRTFEEMQFLRSKRSEGTSVGPIVKPEILNEIADADEACAWMRPHCLPMLRTPEPWVVHRKTGLPRGGYQVIRKPLLIAAGEAYPFEALPPNLLVAVNKLQSVPWRINRKVLDTYHTAKSLGLHSLMLAAPEIPLDPPVPDDEWEAMTDEARRDVKFRRMSTRTHNITTLGDRIIEREVLETADEFEGHPEFWFPFNMDFRGRVYPLPGQPHPQGAKPARAMLEFAAGKPIGEAGLQWLCYAAASAWGMDKVSRQEQLAWVNAHTTEIIRSAEAPFGEHFDFWSGCSEPWQFIAAALDLTAALRARRPYQHVSHQPVYIDGTCNGLQHLSAMLRDYDGGLRTNLVPDVPRHDLYTLVKEQIEQALQAKVTAGSATAEENALHQALTRALVKRAVMTTPYGVTRYGIVEFLVKEGHLAEAAKRTKISEFRLAGALSPLLLTAIGNLVVASRQVTTWLGECAALVSADSPELRWTTPSGYLVRQAYRKPHFKKIETLYGAGKRRLRLQYPVGSDPHPHKQALGITPNLIHSFDADHMRAVVLTFPAETISTIHDCFGTHACDMDLLRTVVLDTFARMYRENHLKRLHREFQQQTSASLPSPPPVGQLDIDRVRECMYAFA